MNATKESWLACDKTCFYTKSWFLLWNTEESSWGFTSPCQSFLPQFPWYSPFYVFYQAFERRIGNFEMLCLLGVLSFRSRQSFLLMFTCGIIESRKCCSQNLTEIKPRDTFVVNVLATKLAFQSIICCNSPNHLYRGNSWFSPSGGVCSLDIYQFVVFVLLLIRAK